MGDQDHEKVDCPICNSTGFTLKGREPRPCFCGEQVDAKELERRFLAERGIKAKPGIKEHPLAGDPSDEERRLQAISKADEERRARRDAALAQLDEQPQERVSEPAWKVDVVELERQFLEENGIKAKPGIKEHLLPHEGGQLSENQQALKAILKADEEMKERYGPELYRAYRAGQFSESEADEIVRIRARGCKVTS